MTESKIDAANSDSSADESWLQVLAGQTLASDVSSRKAQGLRGALLEPEAGTPTEVLRPDQQRQIRALLDAGFRGQGLLRAAVGEVSDTPPLAAGAGASAQHPGPKSSRRGARTAPVRHWLATPWAGSLAAFATLATLSMLLVWHGHFVEPSNGRHFGGASVIVVDADPALHALRVWDCMRQLGVRVELQGEVTLSASISPDQIEPVKRYLASQGIEWQGGDNLALVVRAAEGTPAGREKGSTPR